MHDLPSRAAQVMTELREKSAEAERLSQKLADSKVDGLFETVQTVDGIPYLTAMLSGTKPDSLRTLGDKIKEKMPKGVALVVGTDEGKATMLCVCGKEAAANGVHAGKIVQKAAAITGGKGGGRPDNAMAGINDLHKIDEALDALPAIIREVLGK